MSTRPVVSLCALLLWVSAFGGPSLAAQMPTEEIVLGGRSGWDDIAAATNLSIAPGWQGGSDLVLDDSAGAPIAASDLWVNFDAGVGDATGNYTSDSRGVTRVSQPTRFGAGAAAFRGDATISFRPGPGSLLAPSTQPGSFAVEMWLQPTHVREGAVILRWRGALLNAGSPVLQEFRLQVDRGRLQWVLSNIVVVPDASGRRRMTSVSLPARRGLVPMTWAHHRFSYDASTGRIAYEVDGVVEAVAYLTRSGREDGAPLALLFGSDTGDGLVVGGGYEGIMDELRIIRDAYPTAQATRYTGDPARAWTSPILLGNGSTRLDAIEVRAAEPGRTAVRTFYRVSDLVTSRDPEQALDAAWLEVPEDGRIPGNVRGRYLQLRFDLLADARRADTPRVQQVHVRYEPAPPPPVPTGVRSTPIPGGVRIEWDAILLQDVAGFRVYHGERPGRYTGSGAVTSPMDVGDVTAVDITGLEPDRPYVFAVESHDAYGATSALSREVQERAGRMR